MNPTDGGELFLLALIERGLSTPYDFKVRAGLSVGSAVSVLGRLEKSGLIEGGKPDSRGSRRFTITKAGAKALRAEWKSLLAKRPTDTDEILRISYLAWAMGDSTIAAQFMDRAASDLVGLAATRKAEAAQMKSMIGDEPAGEAYRWLKANVEAARLEAAALALRGVSKEVMGSKKTKKRT